MLSWIFSLALFTCIESGESVWNNSSQNLLSMSCLAKTRGSDLRVFFLDSLYRPESDVKTDWTLVLNQLEAACTPMGHLILTLFWRAGA
jgi:hypothetical protein